MQAGEAVLAEPEVRHVTLPESGGRIVIASDGLWDAVSAKSALHHVRGMPPNKAARDLVSVSHQESSTLCSPYLFPPE